MVKQRANIDDDEDDEESSKGFLKPNQKDNDDENIIAESDDESIFEKLRDEVEHELYNGGPRAVVHRHKDSKIEVYSDD